MSDSSKRGKNLELDVAATLRKKLGARVHRDSRSGAGTHKQDIRDYFQELPFSIECKDHETIKIKEWMRQAIDAASFHQIPTLVFRMDEEILATVRFSDLVNLAVEIADLKAEVADLREPVVASVHVAGPVSPKSAEAIGQVIKAAANRSKQPGVKTDGNGHIADDYGYCNQKGCKYSRGYRAPKGKK